MRSNAFLPPLLRRLYAVLSAIAVLLLTAPAAADAAQTADQARALALLNADRVERGLAPLIYSDELTKLAEDYARDMIERRFFSHDNPEGLTPFDRMSGYGISYRHAGENLAINDTVAAAQTAFMNSPSHRANILHADYQEVGIGVQYAPNGKLYVVQEFVGH